MAIKPQSAAIVGGALFGAYTSDIQENPLSGLLTTGIGAATGAFLRIPETDLRRLSQVSVGPSLDIDEIINRRTVGEIKLEQAREKALKLVNNLHDRSINLHQKIENRYSYIAEAERKYVENRKSANAYAAQQGRRLRAQEKELIFKQSPLEREIEKLTLSAMDRASYLERTAIPTAQAKFELLKNKSYDRIARQGFISDSTSISPAVIGNTKLNSKLHKTFRDSDIATEVVKFAYGLPNADEIHNKASALASRRINDNKAHYTALAEDRVMSKRLKYAFQQSDVLNDARKYGLKLNGDGRLERLDLKDFNSQYIVRDSSGNVVGMFADGSEEVASYRRQNKLSKFSIDNKEYQKWKEATGAAPQSFSFERQVEFDGKWVSNKELIESQQRAIEGYNVREWYLDKTNTLEGKARAISLSLEVTQRKMARGFIAQDQVPEYLRQLKITDPGEVGNVKAYLTKMEMDKFFEGLGGSLTVANIQEEIDKLRSPSMLEEIRQQAIAMVGDNQADFEVARQRGLETLDSQANLLLTGKKQTLLNAHLNFARQRAKHNQALESLTERERLNTLNIARVQGVLNEKGIVTNTIEDVIEEVAKIKDPDLLTKITGALKGVPLDLKNAVVKELEGSFLVTSPSELGIIENYFRKALNNSPEMAKEKAKLISGRATGDLVFSDGSVQFTDRVSGKKVNMPLTSYTSGGLRYHDAGLGTFNTVSQFNPYGRQFARNGKAVIDGNKRAVTVQDLLKGQDPEMMLKYLPENARIEDVVSNMKSLMHYDSTGSGTSIKGIGDRAAIAESQAFHSMQGAISFGYTLNYDNNGEIDLERPFKPLQVLSKGGKISDSSKILSEISNSTNIGAHIRDGISNSDLVSIQTRALQPLSPMAPYERGDMIVGNRGYRLGNVNSYTESVRSLIGESIFKNQFSSSQVFKKIDVMNAQEFNNLFSRMTGNNANVLAEGAGFYNMDLGQDFVVRDTARLKIPLNGSVLLNDQLIAAQQSGNINEYLKNNVVMLDNESVARTSQGRMIGLNGMYTGGKVTDAAISSDGFLRLSVDAFFDPNEKERNTKLYSVGTKSLNTGLETDQFRTGAALAEMLNSGQLARIDGDRFLLGAREASYDEVVSAVNERAKNITANYHLIGDASETGLSKIIPHVREGKLVGNKVFDMIDNIPGVAASDNQKVLTSLLFTENKAATDLTATLLTSLNQRADTLFGRAEEAFKTKGSPLDISDKALRDLTEGGFLRGTSNQQFNLNALQAEKNAWRNRTTQEFSEVFSSQNFLNSSNKEVLLETALNLVKSSGITEDIMEGKAYAIGSLNKGQSIVGAGNSAKISWTALQNLKMSGITNEDLSIFGSLNEEYTYEARSTLGEYKRSAYGLEGIVKHRESELINLLGQNVDPELRFDILANMFDEGDLYDTHNKNPFLTYNLSYDKHDIKSLNFSRVTTNRSGTYEGDTEIKMLKQLEKRKLDVLIADVEYQKARGSKDKKVKEETLKRTLEEYQKETRQMYAGENNILKKMMALESEHSSIMQVKGIGGTAEKYSEEMLKQNKHVWFISEEEANAKAKQLGYDTLELQDIYDQNGKNTGLKSAKYRHSATGELIELTSLLTREPAQGPLSTDLVTWVVDSSLKGEHTLNNAYVANNNIIYTKAQFGDMDQDTVQTVLGHFSSNKQLNEMQGKRADVRNTFLGMQDLLQEISVKGAERIPKNILDFDDFDEYGRYRAAAGRKGVNRKALAAPATGLAVAYAKAMELELNNGLSNTQLLEGRILSHQLVENLIKSAHLSTESFLTPNLQVVEDLSYARRMFIGKEKDRIGTDAYKKKLEEYLPQFLQADKATGERKAQLDEIIQRMIDAELKHSYKVGNNPFNPMDLQEHRYKASWTDSMVSILKEHGMHKMDDASFAEEPVKSAKQMAGGMTEMVKNIFSNNKKVIFGGLAAMGGVAIIGRDSPSFSDSRSNIREHSSKMLEASVPERVGSINDTPMGISTNNIKSNYITPKVYSNRGIQVDGSFVESSYDSYNSIEDNLQDQAHDIASAAFGTGIRTARIQTN